MLSISTPTDFYPRSPCGERLELDNSGNITSQFLSTLSLRRATLRHTTYKYGTLISIHALLAESDGPGLFLCSPLCISIHALLAESDRCRFSARATRSRFLSTLSLRRATAWTWCRRPLLYISIHALLAESDGIGHDGVRRIVEFLSTLSLRRATYTAIVLAPPIQISIHALLAESDQQNRFAAGPHCLFLSTLSLRRATCPLRQLQSALCHFYPRSPCGERR